MVSTGNALEGRLEQHHTHPEARCKSAACTGPTLIFTPFANRHLDAVKFGSAGCQFPINAASIDLVILYSPISFGGIWIPTLIKPADILQPRIAHKRPMIHIRMIHHQIHALALDSRLLLLRIRLKRLSPLSQFRHLVHALRFRILVPTRPGPRASLLCLAFLLFDARAHISQVSRVGRFNDVIGYDDRAGSYEPEFFEAFEIGRVERFDVV